MKNYFFLRKYWISFADIHYKILVETGQSGIDANVILCIFGDEETTTNLPLKTTKDGTDAKFEIHSSLEFDLQAVDVGKVRFGFNEEWIDGNCYFIRLKKSILVMMETVLNINGF